MLTQLPRIMLTALCLFSTSGHSQTYPPFAIERSSVIEFPSKLVGKKYQLYVKLPISYLTSARNYPLLVMSDADYAFPLISSITRQMGDYGDNIDEVILVGISYAMGDNTGVSRTRDYTPTHSPKEWSGHSDEAKQVSGGAVNYVHFLSNEVFPYLFERYRIDADKKLYTGHSFGGLLGAYMLVSTPELFDYYIIGSPSLWYDNKVIFRLEEEYARKNKTLKAKVIMITGSLENNGRFKMVDDMEAFATQLRARQYQGLDIHVAVLPDERHLSVFPSLVTDGLLWAIPEP